MTNAFSNVLSGCGCGISHDVRYSFGPMVDLLCRLTLHHYTYQGLGARRTQQHAAAAIKIALGFRLDGF